MIEEYSRFIVKKMFDSKRLKFPANIFVARLKPCLCVLLFDEYDYCCGRNSLLATLEAQMLGGGCLERYALDVEAANLGYGLTHGVDIGAELWSLCRYCAVEV